MSNSSIIYKTSPSLTETPQTYNKLIPDRINENTSIYIENEDLNIQDQLKTQKQRQIDSVIDTKVQDALSKSIQEKSNCNHKVKESIHSFNSEDCKYITKSPIKSRPNYCDANIELRQKYPLEHMKKLHRDKSSKKQESILIESQTRQVQKQIPLGQNIDKYASMPNIPQYQISNNKQLNDKQTELQLNRSQFNQQRVNTVIESKDQIKGILEKYEKIMQEDFDRFTSHRRCLNNANIYLAYIFHFLQSLGIFTTTLSSAFAHTQLIWIGVFLNCTASLIYIYEQLNNKIAYKLQQNILAIMQNEYQGEIQVIEPQQDLNMIDVKKTQGVQYKNQSNDQQHIQITERQLHNKDQLIQPRILENKDDLV